MRKTRREVLNSRKVKKEKLPEWLQETMESNNKLDWETVKALLVLLAILLAFAFSCGLTMLIAAAAVKIITG